MVGVPSSRGCDACRKQKKRCDVENDRPPCARCKRLKIDCVGYGGNRFKFQSENARFDAADRSEQQQQQQQQQQTCKPQAIPARSQSLVRLPPSNSLDRLTASFVHDIDATVDVSFQLPQNFGVFLMEVPRRLGHNPALDSAASALMAVYQRFKNPESATVNQRLMKEYVKALGALRDTIGNPELATKPETLCAISIIIVFEVLSGPNPASAIQHCSGASRIFKVRGFGDNHDPLDRQLVKSLRAQTILQSLFLDNITFTEREWSLLIDYEISPDDANERYFQSLTLFAWCFRRARSLMQELEAADGVRQDLHFYLGLVSQKLQQLELRLQGEINELESMYHDIDAACQRTRLLGRDPTNVAKLSHGFAAKSYGFALATQVLVLTLQKALAVLNRQRDMWAAQQPLDEALLRSFEAQTARLARGIVDVADAVQCYRPLGSIFLAFIVRIAYVGIPREHQLDMPIPATTDEGAEVREAGQSSGELEPQPEPQPDERGYLERRIRRILWDCQVDMTCWSPSGAHLARHAPFASLEDLQLALGCEWMRRHFHLGIDMPEPGAPRGDNEAPVG